MRLCMRREDQPRLSRDLNPQLTSLKTKFGTCIKKTYPENPFLGGSGLKLHLLSVVCGWVFSLLFFFFLSYLINRPGWHILWHKNQLQPPAAAPPHTRPAVINIYVKISRARKLIKALCSLCCHIALST